ncbi:MAG: hypothetical protein J7L11_09385 [Thermoprotei archaeon]|nr:hypothetical protein [Thermoprotei archaeon]
MVSLSQRMIPIINLILFLIYLAYMLVYIVPLFQRLKYPGPLIGVIVSIVGLGIATLISFILYFHKRT